MLQYIDNLMVSCCAKYQYQVTWIQPIWQTVYCVGLELRIGPGLGIEVDPHKPSSALDLSQICSVLSQMV